MKKQLFLVLLLVAVCFSVNAQVGINTDNSAPNASAILDVKSTTRGMLLPRMTIAERNVIASPATGLLVYCTDNNHFYTNKGTPASPNWVMISSQWITSGTDITYNAGKVGIGTTAPVNSAVLELKSTSQGFLPPRMTAVQRDAIIAPAEGLMIYCMDCPSPNNIQVYTTGRWFPMTYNRFPVATNVTQTGYPAIGLALLGSYSYADADNDPQGLSTFKWYRADNPSGLNETAISGATSQSYSLVAADLNKYIRFAVVPVATTGASPGDEGKSSGFIGPVISWNCGAPITVNHVIGAVAPVTKTATYGTVTNIPGETSRCWITSNLGASNQATAVDDATEPSSGWYWQFNRKQGYKYDGSILTPEVWISSISEVSDWTAANDPCALELGVGWRIPTSTEWTNVDAAGSWTDWNGPWNSGLKIHGAGYIWYANGLLYYRGSYGFQWSSTQQTANYGYYLDLHPSNSSVNTYYKAEGLSLRCLR